MLCTRTVEQGELARQSNGADLADCFEAMGAFAQVNALKHSQSMRPESTTRAHYTFPSARSSMICSHEIGQPKQGEQIYHATETSSPAQLVVTTADRTCADEDVFASAGRCFSSAATEARGVGEKRKIWNAANPQAAARSATDSV